MFGNKKSWVFNVVPVEDFDQAEGLPFHTLGWVVGEGDGPYWYSGNAKSDAFAKMRADPRFAGQKVSLGLDVRDAE